MVIAMRVFLVVIGILSAILGSTLSAHSDEIPNLDVKQLCRGIASQATDPLAGGEPSASRRRLELIIIEPECEPAPGRRGGARSVAPVALQNLRSIHQAKLA